MQSSIILASQSPRRKQLLEWAEIPFEVRVSEADESFPAHLKPEEAAMHIAKKKANVITALYKPSIPVLAADTMVVCEKDILGKPLNVEDALQMITKLAGKSHEVITGVCIQQGTRELLFYDKTLVTFHPLSTAQIQFYVDKYKPFDKAGAYAIQEWIGVVGIKSIQGDFYNVMGLPVSRVVQELHQFTSSNVE